MGKSMSTQISLTEVGVLKADTSEFNPINEADKLYFHRKFLSTEEVSIENAANNYRSVADKSRVAQICVTDSIRAAQRYGIMMVRPFINGIKVLIQNY